MTHLSKWALALEIYALIYLLIFKGLKDSVFKMLLVPRVSPPGLQVGRQMFAAWRKGGESWSTVCTVKHGMGIVEAI